MTTKQLALEPADVTVTVDRFGREVAVIPDGAAAALAAEVQNGWSEFKGLSYGESRRFDPGTWVYDTTVTLLAAYAATAVPGGLSEDQDWLAKRDRKHAESGWSLYVFIVGAGGWDFEDRTWRDYEKTRHLRVMGSIHLRGTAYRYEG